MKVKASHNTTRLLLSVIAVGLIIAACGGGGTSSGSGVAGTSIVRGSISEFSSGQAFFVPAVKPESHQSLIAALTNFLVSPARAMANGVVVNIDGKSTISRSDGAWEIGGVQTGNHDLEFCMDMRVGFNIGVPANAIVEISNVRVESSGAAAGSIATSSRMRSPINNPE